MLVLTRTNATAAVSEAELQLSPHQTGDQPPPSASYTISFSDPREWWDPWDGKLDYHARNASHYANLFFNHSVILSSMPFVLKPYV